METNISRSYCLHHPGEIISNFGVGSFLRVMLGRERDLLAALVARHRNHGIALPGQPGNAYRISSIIEFRVARVYGQLAEHFKSQPEAAAFFRELQEEEKQHGHLMLLCMYTVNNDPPLRFVPTIKDPTVVALLERLKRVEAAIPSLTLDEALAITHELETSEINTIFDRLLAQSNHPSTRFFRKRFDALEGHAESIPRRIAELKATLAGGAH